MMSTAFLTTKTPRHESESELGVLVSLWFKVRIGKRLPVVSIPIRCVDFFVPFRNEMASKALSFTRDQSAQILLADPVPNFVSTLKKEISTCQTMEVSTKEQLEQ
jgi:hypothetical protein